jgi:hypothetical protein
LPLVVGTDRRLKIEDWSHVMMDNQSVSEPLAENDVQALARLRGARDKRVRAELGQGDRRPGPT